MHVRWVITHLIQHRTHMLTRAQFLQFLTPFCCARKRLIDCNPCKFTPEAHSRNKELGVCLRRDTSVAARLPLPGVRTLLALPYRTCPSGAMTRRGHGTVTHRPLGGLGFLISRTFWNLNLLTRNGPSPSLSLSRPGPGPIQVRALRPYWSHLLVSGDTRLRNPF